jgi:beta-RFAP synthase
MIRVEAPSRLHFGLLSCGQASSSPGNSREQAVAVRQFGSVGLMIQKPGVAVEVRRAATWSSEGPLAERALAVARTFSESVEGAKTFPLHVTVVRCAREHVGLGTGTQLALAVAGAAMVVWDVPEMSTVALAQRVGRGRRSALGVHGFAHGGFLVDGGKRHPSELAPLIARCDFPEDWRLVVVQPPGGHGLHGQAEIDAFERLAVQSLPDGVTERLCRLALLGMLPALAEHDLQGFGEALFEFNSRVGSLFAPVQGGTYGDARVTGVVTFLRQQGVRGVGQSSWGPSVFAVTDGPDCAEAISRQIQQHFSMGAKHVLVTPACNRGALFKTGREDRS